MCPKIQAVNFRQQIILWEIKPYIVYKEIKEKSEKLRLQNFQNKELKTKYQTKINTKLENKDSTQTKWTDMAQILKDTAKETLSTT